MSTCQIVFPWMRSIPLSTLCTERNGNSPERQAVRIGLDPTVLIQLSWFAQPGLPNDREYRFRRDTLIRFRTRMTDANVLVSKLEASTIDCREFL